MEDSKKENTVTVQGVMTPVPAASCSVRAGYRSSLSSDCNDTPVGLAGVPDNATSYENLNNRAQGSIAEANPFLRSGKTQRSPISRSGRAFQCPRVEPQKSKSGEQDIHVAEETPRSAYDKPRTAEAGKTSTEADSSPRQEFILGMRKAEEDTIVKCRDTLKKIKQAMSRQKNISMDVKTGVSELEELLDILGDYRRNWKTAESEKLKSVTLAQKNTQLAEDCQSGSLPSQKRVATSPAEKCTPVKRQKDLTQKQEPKRNPIEKQKKSDDKVLPVTSNKKSAARDKPQIKTPRHRADAVIIKPSDGYSYADVLKKLKENVKPEDANVTVRSIRKTKTGALLLEVVHGGKAEQFSGAIKESLKEAAQVMDLKPKVTIEIRDIDCTSTKEEVTTAVRQATEATEEDITVRLTSLNTRDQRRAFVVLPTNRAKILMKTERIKIGWTNCRLRYREEDKRCFKCFGLGHVQRECRGPDRKARGVCIRCGEVGHILRQCKNPPKCCICVEQGKPSTDHLPGTKNCKADIQL